MTDQPGYIERQLGGAPVDVVLAGDIVPADAVGPITMRRWRPRADPDTRPEAAQLTMTVLTDKLVTAPEIGSVLTVTRSALAMAYFGANGQDGGLYRFFGTVTDLVAIPATRRQPAAQLQIVAVGPRAQLGQIPVGDAPWPQENDAARATRILNAAHAWQGSLTIGVADPGTVAVLARDVDRQPALALLDKLAQDSGGELVEGRSMGTLTWRDALARQNAVPLLELTAENVLAPAQFRQSLEGMVNDLTMAYGPPAPTDQATVHIADITPANGAYGVVAASQATDLALEADAQSRATDIVGRRNRPRWRLDDIAVDLMRTLTKPQAAALLRSNFGDLVTVSGLPTSAPFISLQAFIEGQTEVITRDSWTMVLAMTDKAWTGTGTRWVDVPGYDPETWRYWSWTRRGWVYTQPTSASPNGPSWQDMDATMSWIQAISWDPGDTETDRWLDYPAATRWSQEPAALTWATV